MRRTDPNGVITNWTTITESVNEVKLAVVQQTANGFTQGEVYFNGQNPGDLARIAANGVTWNTNWASLPNEPFYDEGGFYVDQSGVFSNELIVVTGQQSSDGADIWRVRTPTNATWLAYIPAVHCEGVITLPNDVMRWGPWAGKIITGAEQMADPRLPTLTYAIDTNGVVTTFDLGISAEDFDIIRLNQDLYCLYEAEGKVLKLSHTLLQEYVGDLLVTQGGLYVGVPELFIVHWDGAKFVTRLIPLDYYSQGTYVVPELEQSTFAPIELPVISPVMNMVAPLLPGGLPQLP